MQCVNCGRDNLEKALVCYWCGMDPKSGDSPYAALQVPIDQGDATPVAPPPPAIELPPPIPVPDVSVVQADWHTFDIEMPRPPQIEVAPPPDIPTEEQFTAARRQRMRHPVVVRAAPAPPITSRPLLSGPARLQVFIGGLVFLVAMGIVLSTALSAASLGNALVVVVLLVGGIVVWFGLLTARVGRRAAAQAAAVYERVESLGRVLREVIPGTVQELPVNLPASLGVYDLPVAYSELRALAAASNEPSLEMAVDLLTGAIATLVARDDVILARRTWPMRTQGLLARSDTRQMSVPVLTRRRAYAGPGQLEAHLARLLPSGQPVPVAELVEALLTDEIGAEGRQGPARLVRWVQETLEEHPPDLEALPAPDEALERLQNYRQAIREADPELYKLLEAQVRRGLGALTGKGLSSPFDLARYARPSARRRNQRRTRS